MFTLDEPRTEQKTYSISALNGAVKKLLEQGIGRITVTGEISNFMAASSGHWYFSLKDDKAQVSCAMFRGNNRLLNFRPNNGAQVEATVRVTLYEPRGNYQLIVERMTEAGDGALKQAFEQLKAKLQAEGLFDHERKKELPQFPRRIAIVTSPTGAAIRDMLHVLQRRYPIAQVSVFPCLVQGTGAAENIAAQIELINKHQAHDVVIVGRGGGSLEDLNAFNEEIVARAIVNCSIPIVSGVGHEVDVSIADFVADVRAPTPSAAAEIISPCLDDWQEHFISCHEQLQNRMRARLQQLSERLYHLNKRLQHPGERLERLAQRIDECESRLQQQMKFELGHNKTQLVGLQQRLLSQHPTKQVASMRQQLSQLKQRLELACQRLLKDQQQRLASCIRALDAVSPLATLHRGYAIAQQQGKVITNSQQLSKEHPLEITLEHGRAQCQVLSTEEHS